MSRFRASVAAVFVTLLLLETNALAIPDLISVHDYEDDASLIFKVWSEYSVGDVESYCYLFVDVQGYDEPLTAGDTVDVWIYEDDFTNDLLFHDNWVVSADEAAENEFLRLLTPDTEDQCILGTLEDDAGEEWELFARLRVEKAECGVVCIQDDFTTDNLVVAEVTDDWDDLVNGDDTMEEALAMDLGVWYEVISRDDDWSWFAIEETSEVWVQLWHIANTGRIEGAFFDTDGMSINVETVEMEYSTWITADLDPGEYYLRVRHRDMNNYNHYDVGVVAYGLSCSAGEVETLDCGNCGVQTRTCVDDGWGDWTECHNEGVCGLGEEITVQCEMCAIRVDTCSDTCQWVAGVCDGGGACEPDSIDDNGCAGATRRICDDTCAWGECFGNECEEGDSQVCYSGPAATEGVGACASGLRTCSDGIWGSCMGQNLPVAENCGDGWDNDCDGETDDTDSQCFHGCQDDSDCTDPLFPVCGVETGECVARAGCQSNVDCDDPSEPVCNISTGECGPASTTGSDTQSNPGPNMGPDVGSSGGFDAGYDAYGGWDSGANNAAEPDLGNGHCQMVADGNTAPVEPLLLGLAFALAFLCCRRKARPEPKPVPIQTCNSTTSPSRRT